MNTVNTPSNVVSNTTHSNAPSTSSHHTACAGCKYQRRKCTANCTLAPFFPANKTGDFLNAHRFYGISNMLKILKSVPSDFRHETMRSIILHSNLRALDPVGGCYRQVLNLTNSIHAANTELDNVKKMIAIARSQQDAAAANTFPNFFSSPETNVACSLKRPRQQDYNNHISYAELRPEVEVEQQSMQQMPTPHWSNSYVENVHEHPFLHLAQTVEPCQIGEREESITDIAGSSTITALSHSTMNEPHFDLEPYLYVQEQEPVFSCDASFFTRTTQTNFCAGNGKRRKIT